MPNPGPRRIACLAAVALILALMLTAVLPGAAAADGRWRFFPETGCWVGNEFLDFFEKRGGLDIFGYPIENAVIEGSLTVQYFQRARMELHPDEPAAYRVQLGLVGQELRGAIDPPVTHDRLPAVGDRNHQYFPETGQVVSYSFLDFYRTRGDVDIFGYPISAEATENGMIVQYFQRARMEWHPNNPTRYRVQLGLVGEEYYFKRYGGRPVQSPVTATLATPTAGQPPAATATSGRAPAPASPSAPAAGRTATPAGAQPQDQGLTISHLIMFIVAFATVVLVGLALLWRRGSLQDWLSRRGGPPTPPAPTAGDWRQGM